MGSPVLKVVIVCFITMILVFIIARIILYLDRRRYEKIWADRGLVTTTMTNRTLDDVYGYEPSVAAAPSGNVSTGPSVSVSPSASVSPSIEPTGTESISPSGDYVDPYEGTQLYNMDAVSSISYIPNPAVHHHRIEDEIIVRRDSYGNQYIVGTRRREKEDETVFSPSPKDRPSRKLDE